MRFDVPKKILAVVCLPCCCPLFLFLSTSGVVEIGLFSTK